jgi:hypothetical protein
VDAVPVEPKDSGGIRFVYVAHEPTDVVGTSCWSQAFPTKMEYYLRSAIAHGQRPGRLNQLLDATMSAQEVRALVDVLDEQETEDSPLILRLTGHGTTAEPRVDFVWGNLLFQCKEHRLQAASKPDITEGDAAVSSSATDAEPGAPWQALPRYTDRPFIPRPCCGASVLTPEAVATAQSPKVPVPAPMSSIEFHEFAHRLMFDPVYRQLCAATAPLTVTIRDKQLAQDYRAGLRGLVGGMLDVLGRMIVMILAALSRLAQTPSFLLVMLAVARHYGRRGDGDAHALPASALQPKKQQGVVCLAA